MNRNMNNKGKKQETVSEKNEKIASNNSIAVEQTNQNLLQAGLEKSLSKQPSKLPDSRTTDTEKNKKNQVNYNARNQAISVCFFTPTELTLNDLRSEKFIGNVLKACETIQLHLQDTRILHELSNLELLCFKSYCNGYYEDLVQVLPALKYNNISNNHCLTAILNYIDRQKTINADQVHITEFKLIKTHDWSDSTAEIYILRCILKKCVSYTQDYIKSIEKRSYKTEDTLAKKELVEMFNYQLNKLELDILSDTFRNNMNQKGGILKVLDNITNNIFIHEFNKRNLKLATFDKIVKQPLHQFLLELETREVIVNGEFFTCI